MKLYALNDECEFELRYEGNYLNGERNGYGIEYENNKIIFCGDYLNGKRNGEGIEFENDKIIFQGEYSNGERWTGTLKEYDTKGELISEAEYLNGKRIK